MYSCFTTPSKAKLGFALQEQLSTIIFQINLS